MHSMEKAKSVLLKVFFVAVACVFAQVAANNLAYLERGYDAIGGEIFVSPLVIYFMIKIMFFNIRE